MLSTSTDALSDILKTIRLSAKTYFCRSFGSGWKLQMRHRPEGVFHVVLQGQCYLREGASGKLLQLSPGDIVAFPTGGDHWISDHPDSQGLSAENVVNVEDSGDVLILKTGHVLGFPAGGVQWADSSLCDQVTSAVMPLQGISVSAVETTLLCGTISYDSSVNHPFLKDLPCFIHTGSAKDSELQWLNSLVKVLENESKVSSPGSKLMVDRMTEMLFIQLLRAHMRQHPNGEGYMAALADPKIGAALNLIHSENDEKWTVESLSKAAALGRTSFTEKFSRLVGVSPKTYLTQFRMLRAKDKLQYSDESMLEIAESAGYSSEAAFSKAAKKHFNMTPGQLRRVIRKRQ